MNKRAISFIEKANLKFDNKFEYDSESYINSRLEMNIKCPIHGWLKLKPTVHIESEYGCRLCSNIMSSKKRTGSFDDFVTDAKKIHGETYEYNSDGFKNRRSIIRIKCKIHGEFTQLAKDHLSGKGCSLCGHKHGNHSNREKFIERANIKHKNKYDYSKVLYTTRRDPVTIICKKHGEFIQTPLNHIRGCGCTLCGNTKSKDKRSIQLDEFIQRSIILHNDKYIYNSDIKVLNSKRCIDITCPTHGIFTQDIHSHLKGKGCPLCAEFGFDYKSDGYLYVNVIKSDNVTIGYKFGITNNIKTRLHNQRSKTDYKVQNIFKFKSTGLYVSELEKYLMQNLSTSYLTKDEFQDGYTETVSPDDLEKLEDLIIKYLITNL